MKKQAHGSSLTRLLSALMALVMTLSLLPWTVLSVRAEVPQTLYLKPNANWLDAGARFAAYFFGNGDSWVGMTDSDGDGCYEVSVPEGYPNVIFCRMNPGTTENSWNNKWNQTSDLTIPTDGSNCYTYPEAADAWDNASGAWSTHTPTVTPGQGGADTPPAAAATIYFHNNWNWTDIHVHYWNADSGTEWPGVAMTPVENDVYKIELPAGTAGFLFNGLKDDGSGSRDQSPDITDFTDGNGYEMAWDNGNKTAPFTYVPSQTPTPPETPAATIYFKNNWLWTDVRISCWSAQSETPAEAMTLAGRDGDHEVYTYTVPAGTAGFRITGIKNDGSGDRDATPDITGFADGNGYEMAWDNGNKTIPYTYTPGSQDPDPQPAANYQATLHFVNTKGWNAVYLHRWLDSASGSDTSFSGWPGLSLTQDENGFFSATVEYNAVSHQGLNFIFSNGTGGGSNQTIDLNLPASAYADNKAEKWVMLTTQVEDGRYQARVLDSAEAIVISPTVKDSAVTFQFLAPDAASVEVRGSFCGWGDSDGVAMTKNSAGVWSVTVNNVTPGRHQYKFVADGVWHADPENPDQDAEGNSLFTVSDPRRDVNKITLKIHYTRADGSYENWNVASWDNPASGTHFFADENGEMVATVEMEGRASRTIGFKVRKSVGSNDWADQHDEVRVDLSNILSGTIHVCVSADGTVSQTRDADVVTGNKITGLQLDYAGKTLTITTGKPVSDPATAFKLVDTKARLKVDMENVSASGSKYTFNILDGIDLSQLHRYKIQFLEDQNEAYRSIEYDISADYAYDTEEFNDLYCYDGDDLGAAYTPGRTTFRVWAPTASDVNVKLYSTGSDSEDGAAALGVHDMTPGEKGTWTAAVEGDLKNIYYTYEVTVDGETIEAADPYARAAGVNGQRGMVIDLDSTDPEGWSSDKNPNPLTSYTDAVIYELHVRDFSIDASSGVSAGNRGKYLAFTERGTTVNGEGRISTGVDYLKDLGITHLHLLPIYDYGSVDETRCDTFNWGYDPVNYNVPEGSYSTNPYDGAVRVSEMKQMVQSLHDNGISVIMDVVYNHVYDADKFCFNNIVPGYFSRVDSASSGCGNDTASERAMVRKYIVESVLYWADEYHIDGFRFDLVGLLDVQTINQIVEQVHAIRPDIIFYGEGWEMDGTNRQPADLPLAKQGNASMTPGFGYFSDSIRNLLGGDNGRSTGFAAGADGKESDLAANFKANPWWTKNPQQVIQYASCHDNYTLIDKLVLSTGADGLTQDIRKMNNLAASVYLTAQGVPFIHAGEEFFREKLEEDGSRCENSYNAPDSVNKIVWADLKDEDHLANSNWYKGLIEFRSAHPALRLGTADAVSARVVEQLTADKLVSFWVDGRGLAGETHDSIYLIFNANSAAKTVTLPEGSWDVCVTGQEAGTRVLKTVSGTVEVPGISPLILVQAETENGPVAPAPKSDYALTGSFNSWNHNNFMPFAEGTTDAAAYTMTLTPGSYEFKVRQGDNWYSAAAPIDDSCEGLAMSTAVSGNAILNASGGEYTFTFDIPSKSLTVTRKANAVLGDADEYFLFGYINGENLADGSHPFDKNGKLTVKFDTDSYVCVQNGDGSQVFMTDGWLGSVSAATLHNIKTHSFTAQQDKMMIPGGEEVTLSLTVSPTGSAADLRYTIDRDDVADATGIQDGRTLHCWNWSFAQIEKNMAKIASQGYTAIQTSPVQAMKEPTNLDVNSVGTHWWVYYQPVDFVITTDSGNALGTKAQLESMVKTAHKYGVKVIVDVVANHLANQGDNILSDKIPEKYQASDFWHTITENTSNWNDRYEVTQLCMGGLPDLNTGSKALQADVLAFLKECVDLGVDGFRFDAAKHIETPDDGAFASDFWPTIIDGAEDYAHSKYSKDLYMYGEVLDAIDGLPISAYTKYMAITDNSWGNSLRGSIASGKAALSAGYDKAAAADTLVLWAESHDTFADGSSSGVSEASILKTWALVAARADAMSLYFARPASLDQALGTASVTGWAHDAVKAINEFDEAFAGAGERIGNENGVSYVVRGDSGAVLVQAAAPAARAADVSLSALGMADGSYRDQITGNAFTVKDGVITGQIGSTGIAVVYNAAAPADHTITVQKTTGGTLDADKAIAEAGQTVTITVTPDSGKALKELSVWDAAGKDVPFTKASGILSRVRALFAGDDGSGQYTFTMPESSVTVSAEFAAPHGIEVETASGGKAETDLDAAFAGDTVTITLDPGAEKELDQLNVTDAGGNTVAVTPTGDPNVFTFTMPDADVTIAPSFRTILYSITVEDVEGGSAAVSPDKAAMGTRKVTITVTLDDDDDFVSGKPIVKDADGRKISVSKGTKKNQYTFTMPGSDVTVTPVIQRLYEIELKTATGGKITSDPEDKTTEDDTVTITGKPNSGKVLNKIVVKDEDGKTVKVTKKKTNVFTFEMPDSDVTVTPTFTKSTSPSTGDVFPMAALLTAMGASLAGIFLVLLLMKKNSRRR